jgi:hypothetical protein
MTESTLHPADPGYDAELAALAGSARLLRTDPAAGRSPAFRQRGRVALLRELSATPAATPVLPVRRLVSAGVALLLFSLAAMPALAGPGAVVERVAGAADAIGAALGFRPPVSRTAAAPTATPTPVVTSTVAAVTAATATPAAAVAQASPTPSPTAIATPGDRAPGRRSPDEATSGAGAKRRGDEDSTGASHPDHHGAQVSERAHATPPPGQNHGQQVREVARDNHGHQQQQERQAEPGRPATPEPGGSGDKDQQHEQKGKNEPKDEDEPQDKNEQEPEDGKPDQRQADPTATPARPAATPAPAPGESDSGPRGEGGKKDGGKGDGRSGKEKGRGNGR